MEQQNQSEKKTTRKNLFWGLLTAILLLTIWLLTQEQNQSIEKITIAQAGDFFLYAPLYVAIDAGFFAKNELEVSLVSTGGDEKTWAAVISQDASFGVADPTFIAVSDARGVPGKVIASIVNGVPFWGITLDTTVAVFQSPKDLSSYSVGTFPSPSTAYTLQKKMYQDAQLEPNIREGAFGTLLAMLHSKQVDIALELEPNVSQAVDEGAKVLYSLSEVYGNFAITGLTTTPELLRKNPDLARKVVCSIQLALTFIHENPDSTLSILAKRFPEVKQHVAKQALQRVVSDGIIPGNAVIGEAAWSKAISLREEIGDVKNPKSMTIYVDNSFAEWAKINCSVIK